MDRTEPADTNHPHEAQSFAGSVDTSLDAWQKKEEPAVEEQPEDYYETVSKLFDNLIEAPADRDRMALYVDLGDGDKIYLARFMVGDLSRMLRDGKLTKEQFDTLYQRGLDKLNAYQAPRIAKRALGATMIPGAERRLGWDARELAAGEYHREND